jgi:hypothetical protein
VILPSEAEDGLDSPPKGKWQNIAHDSVKRMLVGRKCNSFING